MIDDPLTTPEASAAVIQAGCEVLAGIADGLHWRALAELFRDRAAAYEAMRLAHRDRALRAMQGFPPDPADETGDQPCD